MARVRRNKPYGPRDIVLSLAVLVIPILLISWFFTRTPDRPPIIALDWQPVLAEARSEAPYPVLAPAGLPPTWVATKVRWTPVGKPGLNGDPVPGNTWELGMLSPQDTYLGLTQRDAATTALVTTLSRDGREDGSSTVGGRTWTRWVSADDRSRTLTWIDNGVVTVVYGDVSYEGLEAFASTLTTS